jgi:hypothetical protein
MQREYSWGGETVSTTVCLADVRFRRRGWSNHELAQFHRMIAILCDVGFAIETDSGMTDEGDPWLVFCEVDSGTSPGSTESMSFAPRASANS